MKIKNWKKIGENCWENVYIGEEVNLMKDQPYDSLYKAYYQSGNIRHMISKRFVTKFNALNDAILYMRNHQ